KGTTAMSPGKYRDLARWINRPNPKQCQAFSRFVAGAHSWHKHLPVQQTGSQFYVFVDLYAGYDTVELPGGRTHLVPREKQGFHYTAIPTRDYRARYGHLAYIHPSPNELAPNELAPNELARNELAGDELVSIMDREGRWRFLPAEVLDAGKFHLTA